MAIINLATVNDYDDNAVPYPDWGLQDIGAYELQAHCIGVVASATSVSGEAMAEKTFIGSPTSVSSVVGLSAVDWMLAGASASGSSASGALSTVIRNCAGTVAGVSTSAGILDIEQIFRGHIHGADLVETWTQHGIWQTVIDPTLDTARNPGRVNMRNTLDASVSAYDGTKVRITCLALTGDAVLDGTSIGIMTTGDDFDSAPTRITWDGSNSGTTLSSGVPKVSDEIDFDFDKTKRYGIHVFAEDEDNMVIEDEGFYGIYWTTNADETMTQNIAGNSIGGWIYAIDKLEVFDDVPNVWQATCTTEPNQVFFDGVKGNKQTVIGDVDSASDWYWASNVLYAYSTSDPDTAYTSPGIEAGVSMSSVSGTASADWLLDGVIDGEISTVGAVLELQSVASQVDAVSTVSGSILENQVLAGASDSVSTVAGRSVANWLIDSAVDSVSTVAGIIDIFKSLVGNPTSTSVVTGRTNIEKSLKGDMISASSNISAVTEIPWPGFLGGELRLRMDMGMS